MRSLQCEITTRVLRLALPRKHRGCRAAAPRVETRLGPAQLRENRAATPQQRQTRQTTIAVQMDRLIWMLSTEQCFRAARTLLPMLGTLIQIGLESDVLVGRKSQTNSFCELLLITFVTAFPRQLFLLSGQGHTQHEENQH